MSKMKNLKSTDKGVMVLGLAKSGSHLILAILDALGPGLKMILLRLFLECILCITIVLTLQCFLVIIAPRRDPRH